jgi:hypothetical protein
MFLLSWLQAKNSGFIRNPISKRARRSFAKTALPVISPRRSRRMLRREQLFAVVRESLIRGGVLSTSYEFKVLTLAATGDSFLVLIELALPAEAISDERLLDIERWIQSGAQSRHSMEVRSVYWRRKAVHDQRGMALRAVATAQTRREVPGPSDTAIPRPLKPPLQARPQPIAPDELEAFRRAMRSTASQALRPSPEADLMLRVPESHSDFTALSETQHGKL